MYASHQIKQCHIAIKNLYQTVRYLGNINDTHIKPPIQTCFILPMSCARPSSDKLCVMLSPYDKDPVVYDCFGVPLFASIIRMTHNNKFVDMQNYVVCDKLRESCYLRVGKDCKYVFPNGKIMVAQNAAEAIIALYNGANSVSFATYY